jgi:hypothetical protein
MTGRLTTFFTGSSLSGDMMFPILLMKLKFLGQELYLEDNVYETGPFLKKWFANEIAALEHECSDKLASHFLYRSDERDRGVYFNVINVPYTEFRDLVFNLPDFSDLPIMWSSWTDSNRPVEFIVRCIMDGDTIAINTSGYDYARYRAAACKVDPTMV